MNRLRDITLIIICGLLFYLVDIGSSGKLYNLCMDNLFFHLVSLTHHIYNIFLQFGWLSNDLVILCVYVVINILTMLHWITNENYCISTEIINSMCGFSRDKYFRDIWHFTGVKKFKYYIFIRYIYILITSIIAINKIKKIRLI
jgi:hypothetical protein